MPLYESQIRKKKIDILFYVFFVPGRFKKGCKNSRGFNEILYIVLNLDWTYFSASALQIRKKNRLIYWSLENQTADIKNSQIAIVE